MRAMTWLQRPVPAFATASLPAVAVGAVVCALSGVPAGVWGRNLAAWAAGAVLAAALARWAGRRVLGVAAVLMPLGVGAPMLARGQAGVHRWLDLGPLHVNMAMLLLPAGVVALAVLGERAAWTWIASLLAIGALVLQPDASQACALAGAICVAALGVRSRSSQLRWAFAAAALVLGVLACSRPDPLAPAPLPGSPRG